MTEKNSKRGKKNRAMGASFENRVRVDLESKGFICDKWSNNVDLINGELVKSKNKWAGPGRPMMMGSGFPDFIAFRNQVALDLYEIIGVESKSNGYLDAEERDKCDWMLKNNIFSKILIASKEKVKNRIKINYIDYQSTKRQPPKT